jgi:hypothetical protein
MGVPSTVSNVGNRLIFIIADQEPSDAQLLKSAHDFKITDKPVSLPVATPFETDRERNPENAHCWIF